MRRVIDMSCVPNTGPWKVMARAVRSVVQASKAGFELFELRDAIPRIKEAVASLAGPASGPAFLPNVPGGDGARTEGFYVRCGPGF